MKYTEKVICSFTQRSVPTVDCLHRFLYFY